MVNPDETVPPDSPRTGKPRPRGDESNTSDSRSAEKKSDAQPGSDTEARQAQHLNSVEAGLRALLAANAAMVSELDDDTVLHRIVEEGMGLTGAQYGALGVIGDDGRLAQFVAVGLNDDQVATIGAPPVGHGLLGALITNPGEPIRIDDLSTDPRSVGFPRHHPPMKEFLGVPIHVRDTVYGNLYLANHGGGFTEDQEQAVVALAASAGLAIENARLFTRVRQAALAADRARIARDLHDHVIQQLFGAGLELQALITEGMTQAQERRILAVTDDLDEAIRQIRLAIFTMTPTHGGEPSLRHQVIEIVDKLARDLPRPPHFDFSGVIDGAVSRDLTADVVAVVRECVTNVIRHAHAQSAKVTLQAKQDQLRVIISDDGRGGVDASPRRSGLANLLTRAQERGGTMTIDSSSTGTSITWVAQLN